MALLIGIDEAGYGPNLGPFVMTSVACRVPDELVGVSLWKVLSSAVRQGGDPDDGRMLIDDSKVVYSTARGLLGLERGVHAALGHYRRDCLHDWLEQLCGDGRGELTSEMWYRGDSALPAVAAEDDIHHLNGRFLEVCTHASIADWRARSIVVCPPRFNTLLDDAGSKGAVLAHALGILLQQAEADCAESESIYFFVDKHGGRNTYAAFIQHALPRGVVFAVEEGMARSSYVVHGLGRELRVTFQPRADAEHFCVALASMASKYVREMCMREFNRFWLDHVPGLKPTAGYPVDASRFWKAIQPAATKLGLSATQVWRRK
jgi:ribonuclease HII